MLWAPRSGWLAASAGLPAFRLGRVALFLYPVACELAHAAGGVVEVYWLNRREQQIETLVTPSIESLGCKLWGVQYLAQGKHSLLRIYIEKTEGGISVEECARVSRQVGELLDVEATISSAYTLEVSSPGLDRPLLCPAHYRAVIGEVIDLRLNYPFEGRKKFVGQLVGVDNDEAIVQIGTEEFLLPIETVQKARVVPQFDKTDLRADAGLIQDQPESDGNL